MRHSSLVLLALTFLGTAYAHADALLTGVGFAMTPDKETFTHRLACRGDLARWDFSGTRNIEGSVLYRGDRKSFYIIDPVRKAYVELPAVSPGDQDIRLGLLAFLYVVSRKTLSSEQLKELDQAVATLPLPETLLTFKTKSQTRVNGIPCSRLEAFFGGVKRAEYFTSDAKALQLDGEDFASLQGFLKAADRLYDHFDFLFPEPSGAASGAEKGYTGVSVKRVFYQDDRTVFSLEFKSIGRKGVNDSWFELPAGYKKMEIFDMLFGVTIHH